MQWIPAIYYLFVIAICSWLFYLVTERWKKLSKFKRFFYWFLIIFLGISLYPIASILGNLTLPGELDEMIFLGDKGDTVLVSSVISQGTSLPTNSFRAELIDLNNGHVLGRSSQFSIYSFLIGFQDKLWFYDKDNGLHMRDARNLDVLVNQATLEKNPKLSRGIRNIFHHDSENHQIVVTTEDGFNYSINNDNFNLTEVNQAKLVQMDELGVNPDQHDGFLLSNIDLPNKTSAFLIDDDVRNQIEKESDSGDKPLFPNANLFFLAGQFVADGFTQRHLALDSNKSLLIISKINLSDETRNLFSKISLDGKLLWQKQLFERQDDEYIKQVHLVSDNIVIITDYRVMAFSSKDGSQQWSETF